MKALDIYRSCIPSCTDMIGETVANVINSIAKSYGPIDESTLFELKVIINEIMINAIKHGNKGDRSKLVRVHAGLSDSGYALILVEDEGSGYDYGDICLRHDPAGEQINLCSFEESGRGIMIVNSLCDRVRVNARGNRILVVKKLAGCPGTCE